MGEAQSSLSYHETSSVPDYILSRINNTESLIECQGPCLVTSFTQTLPGVPIETPYFIEVPIPFLLVPSHPEESCIENIINHFSKPYEELYQKFNPSSLAPPISTQSAIPSLLSVPKETEVELAYSELPGETEFKLPLDSYAQIESLISNSSQKSSRPPTERSLPNLDEPLELRERHSQSLLEQYEENERALQEENADLRGNLEKMCVRVGDLEAEKKDL